jgi:HlyD family secretion protein
MPVDAIQLALVRVDDDRMTGRHHHPRQSMPRTSRKALHASFGLRFMLAAAILAAACCMFGAYWARRSSRPVRAIEWSVARRADLDTKLLVGGELQPRNETSVSCQVEDITDSDGTVIVSMVDNGTRVKKGDTLCSLDSSQLEELAREEEIAAISARSAREQARLALEVATIALREYQHGLVLQTTKTLEGRIALAESDSQRQLDRVAWSEAMHAKGYISKAQVVTERRTLEQSRHDLRKAEGELRLFREYQSPKEILRLRGEVEIAENNYGLESTRWKAQEERLAYTRKQIENCRVLAPHDGVAIVARKNGWWSTPLAPGSLVYQNQVLFKIPDLSAMEVEVSVHETVGHRVRVGMRAHVRIATVPDRVFAGQVTSIIPFPVNNWKEWDETLRHYIGRVRLAETPPAALPGATAAVEIDTGRVSDALVIPIGAMSLVDGRACCYVVGSEGVEERTIAIGSATTDFLEVTEGLVAGERVVSQFASAHGRATN